LGVLSAAFRRGTLGTSFSALSLVGVCLPTMVLGPVLILLFSLKLKIFNTMGWNISGDIVLPAITLSFFYIAWISRLTRSGVVEELDRGYVKTARAKGVSESKIFCVHILRNALQPVVSYLGPAAAGLLTGSFVVESIFQIPGLGKFFVSSALDNDYTMILGCVMLYAGFILIFNLFSDVLLALLNPKIAKELKK
jgi:oligopeptide transport system permease protein